MDLYFSLPIEYQVSTTDHKNNIFCSYDKRFPFIRLKTCVCPLSLVSHNQYGVASIYNCNFNFSSLSFCAFTFSISYYLVFSASFYFAILYFTRSVFGRISVTLDLNLDSKLGSTTAVVIIVSLNYFYYMKLNIN